jgi:hypothetical protein
VVKWQLGQRFFGWTKNMTFQKIGSRVIFVISGHNNLEDFLKTPHHIFLFFKDLREGILGFWGGWDFVFSHSSILFLKIMSSQKCVVIFVFSILKIQLIK